MSGTRAYTRGCTRTSGHLGSPILAAPLDHTGNHEKSIVAMMANPELNRPISWFMLIPCWYHTNFWSILVQFFGAIENVWSALWADYIPKVAHFVGHSVPVCPLHVRVCAFHGVSTVCPRSSYLWKTLEKRVVFWLQRIFIKIVINLKSHRMVDVDCW